MNITVYCGSGTGNDPEFKNRAAELGKWMADHGHRLVFGGGKYGMMGILSEAVLANGGEVTGVTPGFFIESEVVREDMTELIVSDGMSDRRETMIELADAFIALPGGIGTMDEVTEVMVLKRIGQLTKEDKPMMIYNVNGCYDKWFEFVGDMISNEFLEDYPYAIEVKCIEDISDVLEKEERKLQSK